jgi:hypothetical protein
MINLLSQAFNKLDITIAIHVFELELIKNNYNNSQHSSSQLTSPSFAFRSSNLAARSPKLTGLTAVEVSIEVNGPTS